MDYLGGLSLTYPEAESQQPCNFHFECHIFNEAGGRYTEVGNYCC